MLSCSLKNKLGQERVLQEYQSVIFFAIAHIAQYKEHKTELHIGNRIFFFIIQEDGKLKEGRRKVAAFIIVVMLLKEKLTQGFLFDNQNQLQL